jgi:hypothetical protein
MPLLCSTTTNQPISATASNCALPKSVQKLINIKQSLRKTVNRTTNKYSSNEAKEQSTGNNVTLDDEVELRKSINISNDPTTIISNNNISNSNSKSAKSITSLTAIQPQLNCSLPNDAFSQISSLVKSSNPNSTSSSFNNNHSNLRIKNSSINNNSSSASSRLANVNLYNNSNNISVIAVTAQEITSLTATSLPPTANSSSSSVLQAIRNSMNPPLAKSNPVLPISNSANKNSQQANTTLKINRSGSIVTIKENSSQASNSINNTMVALSQNNSNSSNMAARNKPKSMQTQQPKRQKSNSLSIIDYCNIINLNFNHYRMLTTFCEDSDEASGKLSSSKSAASNMRNSAAANMNVHKQLTLSEQMAALFGSTDCMCYLCRMKQTDSKKLNQLNYEITHDKHNADYSLMKFTQSQPYSQMSALKLFNIMNTDCSLDFGNDSSSGNCTRMRVFIFYLIECL